MYGTSFCQQIRFAGIATCFLAMGCINSIKNTIPAKCLPPELLGVSRDHLTPIDYTVLGQIRPKEHLIAPGDLLGIYIHGILGTGQEVDPEVSFPPDPEIPTPTEWYAKPETIRNLDIPSPVTGSPTTVTADGTVALPYAPKVLVSGLTLSQATEKIREIFSTQLQLLQPDHEFVKVSVIKPRSIKAVVLREDSVMKWPIFKQNNTTLAVKRGSGKVVDLPIYENDVLHALTESDGLPGSDAGNEIWILRASNFEDRDANEALLVDEESSRDSMNGDFVDDSPRIIKIPLKTLPGQTLNVDRSDVILESGDVVFVPARDREHFFVGGVMNGQQVYLPRDAELDVVGAIAMASGQVAGPPGTTLFSKSGPGSVFPPTRVLILRKTPEGGQVTIHVNLKVAVKDRGERIPILPQDVVLLEYTPGELAGNYVLNALRMKMGISRGFFTGGTNAAHNFSYLK